MLTSAFCTYAQYRSDGFKPLHDGLKVLYPALWGDKGGRPHRKHWELAFIAKALQERRLLKPGITGLGFGVGIEPLPAFFAQAGCGIVATDGPEDPLWTETAQHCMGNREKLEGWAELTKQQQADITYQTVDMRAIPSALHGIFDFVWSTSSLEHLGGLAIGEKFIHDSLLCLKPGGVAVHVTEVAVYPQMDREHLTVAIYSPATIERICGELREKGFHVHVNWSLGNAPEDYYADVEPYDGPAHLKVRILLDGCTTGVKNMVITSLGLIIQ